MFNRIFVRIQKLIRKSSDNNRLFRLVEELILIRFDNEEQAREEVKRLKRSGLNDDEIIKRLTYFEELQLLFKPFLQAGNFKDMINATATFSINPVIGKMDKSERKEFIKYLKILFNNDNISKFIGILFNKKNWRITWLLKMIEKENITSKQKIADEIGIDKTTLNKWLKDSFGDRFDNVRKINLKDYFEIMENITLEEGESLKKIGKNLNDYNDRLKKNLFEDRKSLLKKDEMEGLNYKSLKEDMKLEGLDKEIKKVPFRTAQKIVKRLS